MPDRARISWLDVGLATGLVLFGFLGTAPAAANQGLPEPDVLGYSLIVVASAAIVVWRWRPLWTLAVSGVAVATYIALGNGHGPILFAAALAVYGVAVRYPSREVLPSLGALLLIMMAAVAVRITTHTGDVTQYFSVAAWILVPAVVGVLVAVRRTATGKVREAQARRAAFEERLRVAQEVHDVVGHGLAVIAMQAGVALHVLDRSPGKARESLEAIRATSKESLDGLRSELEVLRNGSNGEAAPRRPERGLADLHTLVERIRSSGLPVDLSLGAGLDDVPAEVDGAAYRIVQESLTNVLRHAGAEATAEVRVARSGDLLLVDVVDTGRGDAEVSGAGHGIAGMRRRAAAVGGELGAGPRPDGGFAVRARLPVEGTDA